MKKKRKPERVKAARVMTQKHNPKAERGGGGSREKKYGDTRNDTKENARARARTHTHTHTKTIVQDCDLQPTDETQHDPHDERRIKHP